MQTKPIGNSKKSSSFTKRLNAIINRSHFCEDDVQQVVSLVNSIKAIGDRSAKPLVERLVEFRRDTVWQTSREGSTYPDPIGKKEIGYEVRLSSISALGVIGDKDSLTCLKRAVDDPGDMHRESFETRWYVYRQGKPLSDLAREVIDMLNCSTPS